MVEHIIWQVRVWNIFERFTNRQPLWQSITSVFRVSWVWVFINKVNIFSNTDNNYSFTCLWYSIVCSI